jgi:hypothetical protein
MSLVTDDVKRGIKQLRFIEDRFLNGTLDPVAARRTLQDIIEDKSTPLVMTPSWYSSVDAQIERVSAFLELHGGQEGFRSSDIPAVPNFTPRTKTEVLLLTVMLPNKGRVKGFRRTFDSWWDFIVPPSGLTKWRWEELKSDSKHLRLAKGIEYKPGIRWVAFDPNAHQGKSPKQALEHVIVYGTTLANAEVLMAAALFPEWVASWDGGKSPYPNMSGYQFCWDSVWSHVPCLGRWDGRRRLGLGASWADDASVRWSSPVVREC